MLPFTYFTMSIIKILLWFPSESNQESNSVFKGFHRREISKGTASRGVGRYKEASRGWGSSPSPPQGRDLYPAPPSLLCFLFLLLDKPNQKPEKEEFQRGKLHLQHRGGGKIDA